jgi:hypothetical protein
VQTENSIPLFAVEALPAALARLTGDLFSGFEIPSGSLPDLDNFPRKFMAEDSGEIWSNGLIPGCPFIYVQIAAADSRYFDADKNFPRAGFGNGRVRLYIDSVFWG